MRFAQRRADGLTLAHRERFTAPHMRSPFAIVLVLIGLVLIPRAYVRAGG